MHPRVTLYISLIEMACNFILKFLSNDIFLSAQILRFLIQLQYTGHCLYWAASSFMSQTEKLIFNVEWPYLSTEISQSTHQKSQLAIRQKYLDVLLIVLQPTFTTEPPICLIEGAKGLLRPRGPTPSSSINLPHTPLNSLLSHRIFTTPPKPIWDQSSHFPRHLASITPFVHYSVFHHQSKRRYEKYFNISFVICECILYFLSKIFLLMLYTFFQISLTEVSYYLKYAEFGLIYLDIAWGMDRQKRNKICERL